MGIKRPPTEDYLTKSWCSHTVDYSNLKKKLCAHVESFPGHTINAERKI